MFSSPLKDGILTHLAAQKTYSFWFHADGIFENDDCIIELEADAQVVIHKDVEPFQSKVITTFSNQGHLRGELQSRLDASRDVRGHIENLGSYLDVTLKRCQPIPTFNDADKSLLLVSCCELILSDSSIRKYQSESIDRYWYVSRSPFQVNNRGLTCSDVGFVSWVGYSGDTKTPSTLQPYVSLSSRAGLHFRDAYRYTPATAWPPPEHGPQIAAYRSLKIHEAIAASEKPPPASIRELSDAVNIARVGLSFVLGSSFTPDAVVELREEEERLVVSGIELPSAHVASPRVFFPLDWAQNSAALLEALAASPHQDELRLAMVFSTEANREGLDLNLKFVYSFVALEQLVSELYEGASTILSKPSFRELRDKLSALIDATEDLKSEVKEKLKDNLQGIHRTRILDKTIAVFDRYDVRYQDIWPEGIEAVAGLRKCNNARNNLFHRGGADTDVMAYGGVRIRLLLDRLIFAVLGNQELRDEYERCTAAQVNWLCQSP